jgi:hypothetical protein
MLRAERKGVKKQMKKHLLFVSQSKEQKCRK